MKVHKTGTINTHTIGCRLALTACTRANTSPVAGHTLSDTSPLPLHRPSYTPGTGHSDCSMSSADRMVAARLDRYRRPLTNRPPVDRKVKLDALPTMFLESMVVGMRRRHLDVVVFPGSRSAIEVRNQVVYGGAPAWRGPATNALKDPSRVQRV